MGFNSAFKGLIPSMGLLAVVSVWLSHYVVAEKGFTLSVCINILNKYLLFWLQLLCPTGFLVSAYFLTSQPHDGMRFIQFWFVFVLICALAQSLGLATGAVVEPQVNIPLVWLLKQHINWFHFCEYFANNRHNILNKNLLLFSSPFQQTVFSSFVQY